MMPLTNGAASAIELQHQIDLAYEWSLKNKLKFNPKKCEVLHMGPKNPKFVYRIESAFITAVPEVNDLGITISAKRLLRPSIENAIQRSTHAAVNA